MAKRSLQCLQCWSMLKIVCKKWILWIFEVLHLCKLLRLYQLNSLLYCLIYIITYYSIAAVLKSMHFLHYQGLIYCTFRECCWYANWDTVSKLLRYDLFHNDWCIAESTTVSVDQLRVKYFTHGHISCSRCKIRNFAWNAAPRVCC